MVGFADRTTGVTHARDPFSGCCRLGLMGTLALADNADQNIRKTLQALQPDLPIDSIASSPLQGSTRCS